MKVKITQAGKDILINLELGRTYEALLGIHGDCYIIDDNGTFWYLINDQFIVDPETRVDHYPLDVPTQSEDKPLSEVLKGYSKVTLEI